MAREVTTMKNGQRWFKLMLIAVLMVAMGGMVQAAVFSQLATGGGGFIGDASAYVEAYTFGDTDEYFDVWSPDDLLFEAEASVVFGTPPNLEEYAWGYQSTSAYYYYNAPQTSVTLLTELQSQAYSLDADNGFLDVSGLVQTAYYNYDYNGIFFEISPSAGESAGTPVQVTLDFELSLHATANGGFAEVKNGDDGGSSYLSLNGSTIWEYAPVILGAGDSLDDLVSYTFAAQVGDVLGVNMLTVAGIYLGEGSAKGEAITEATSFFTLSVAPNPVPIPGAIWLFGSGFLGLVGVRRKMKRV